MRRLVIVRAGSGGHARAIFDACQAAGITVAGLLGNHAPAGTAADGLEVLGDERLLDDGAFLRAFDIVAGTGDAGRRRAICERVLAGGGSLGVVIHPSCILAHSAKVAAGTVLLAASVIGAGAEVGRFCIVNTAATVDHDDVLDDGVNICPGAHLSGGVRCGEDAFIGTGAVVIPGIHIGRRAVIGAGATVIRNVPDGVTVVGCPARPIRRRGPAPPP